MKIKKVSGVIFFVVTAFFILFSCTAILAYAEPEFRQEGQDYLIPDGVSVEQFEKAESAQLESINQAEKLNQDIENQNFTVSYNASSIIPGGQELPIDITPPPTYPPEEEEELPPPKPIPGNAPEIEEGQEGYEKAKALMEKIMEQMKKWFEQMKK